MQHPRRDDYFAFLESTGGSISTSGDYEHAFEQDGRRWHHIIDPKIGLPVSHTSSVTILAETGLYADALSTAVFVLGAERALARWASVPGRPRGFAVVDADMKLQVTDGLRDSLVMRAELTDGKLSP